ncbi:hypothetical protein [Paenibacillus elgii]|uniref:hypothetical protein n=1 Tax=Paenibacillus elgii TaxID=189691 RepID=UPI000248C2E9|nr:hypothetical protein [Paenibacillus elgii]
MGYYTRYEIEIAPDSNEVRQAIEDDDTLAYAIGRCSDECKWYDHESDMRAFSERFPDVLFTLSGEGEDNGDLWRKYFRNGKMQHCPAQITYEPFDESKLR